MLEQIELNQHPGWYLAATKPRQELRAIENLTNQGIQAFCPLVKVERLIRGKKQLITEALFSNYIFINIGTDNPLWSKVKSTRGVRDWVRFAGEVASVPNVLIEELIESNRNPNEQMVIKRIEKGQNIRILSGPFVGLKGIFEREDGDARAMVLVEFLGKKTRLNLNNEQIMND